MGITPFFFGGVNASALKINTMTKRYKREELIVHVMINKYRREKENKEIRDDFSNIEERISLVAVKIMFKKNCHGGCHQGPVLHCVMCNILSLLTFDSCKLLLQEQQRNPQTLYFYPKYILTKVIYLMKRHYKAMNRQRRMLTTRFNRRNTHRP